MAVFQQISDRFNEKCVCVCVGGGGEGTGYTERANPNSHIPHLKVQLALAWHNRLVLDRQMYSWYSRYLPFRDDTKTSRGQSPARTDTTIFRPSRTCLYLEVVLYSVAGSSSSSHGLFWYHPTTEHHALCSEGRHGC